MARTLTIGKRRGLQRIASAEAFFFVSAIDHRGSLRRVLDPNDRDSVGDERILALKRRLARHLGPHSSALILDPVYAAAPLLAEGAVAVTPACWWRWSGTATWAAGPSAGPSIFSPFCAR